MQLPLLRNQAHGYMWRQVTHGNRLLGEKDRRELFHGSRDDRPQMHLTELGNSMEVHADKRTGVSGFATPAAPEGNIYETSLCNKT